jgi:hypothetical protein
MHYIAIGILFIALTGCAKTYWVKPGATVADFDVDREECVKNESNASMAAGYGAYPPSQLNANAIIMVDQCLSQRGWRKATPSETTEIESRQQKQPQ